MIFEFMCIITPKNCNFGIELCFNGVVEVLENRRNLKFICDKEDPGKTGMTINGSYKPLLPRGDSDFGWTPNVTMDNGERLCGLYGCEGKETRCCFARIHTSQDREETSIVE